MAWGTDVRVLARLVMVGRRCFLTESGAAWWPGVQMCGRDQAVGVRQRIQLRLSGSGSFFEQRGQLLGEVPVECWRKIVWCPHVPFPVVG